MLDLAVKQRFEAIFADEPPKKKVDPRALQIADFTLLHDTWQEVLELKPRRKRACEIAPKDAVQMLLDARRAVMANGRSEALVDAMETQAFTMAIELPRVIDEEARDLCA